MNMLGEKSGGVREFKFGLRDVVQDADSKIVGIVVSRAPLPGWGNLYGVRCIAGRTALLGEIVSVDERRLSLFQAPPQP